MKIILRIIFVSDKPESRESDGETPDDIIKLLKNLSPEKLEAIKSKMFMTSKDSVEEKSVSELASVKASVDSVAETDSKMQSLNIVKPSTPPLDAKNHPETVSGDKEDCVILLDSDDDLENSLKLSDEQHDSINVQVPSEEESVKTETEVQAASIFITKRGSEENPHREKTAKLIKRECVNPNCPAESQCFIVSPQLILNFYYVPKKSGVVQYVCSSCNDKAILKYEVSLSLLTTSENKF